jgi:hypothetical protein
MLYSRAASGMRNKSANRHPAKQGRFTIAIDAHNYLCVMQLCDFRASTSTHL